MALWGIRTLQEWIPLYDYERFRELMVLYGDLLENIDIFRKEAAPPQKVIWLIGAASER
jgi:hypothetical protein